MKTRARPSDKDILSTHMRRLAQARWAKKTKEQRSAEQRAKILKQYRQGAIEVP